MPASIACNFQGGSVARSGDRWDTRGRMKANPRVTDRREPLTPRQIFNYLDRYVVGQERAKRTIAIAAYNHLKRCAQPARPRRVLAVFYLAPAPSLELETGPMSFTTKAVIESVLAREILDSRGNPTIE